MLTNRIVNKIGLEGEFFVSDNNGLVFPGDYGFETDDFVLLGEFRAKPGATYNETIGNYFDALSKISKRAIDNKLTISYGYKSIPISLKKDVLKRMGTKEIADTKNIYKHEILEYSDDIVIDGKIVYTYISAGLHVHFSREIISTYTDKDTTISTNTNILTGKQKFSIIKYMDKHVYTNYKCDQTLKYRMPGYYEDKPYGFEYRSLPMIPAFATYDGIYNLVNRSFSALYSIDK